MDRLNTLDLFCGAGCLSTGFSKQGFNIVAGVDKEQYAVKTFKENHDSKGITADLTETETSEIEDRINKNINIVIGGPPCQGFSVANTNRGKHDKRNTLVDVFIDYIQHFNPETVMMENVPAFRRRNYPTDEHDTYEDLVESRLREIGYSVSIDVLNVAYHGVPQKRRRVIVLGSKQSELPEHPEPTHKLPDDEGELPVTPSVGDVLTDAGAEEYIDANNPYVGKIGQNQRYRSDRFTDKYVCCCELYDDVLFDDAGDLIHSVAIGESVSKEEEEEYNLIERGFLKLEDGVIRLTSKSGGVSTVSTIGF